MEKTYWAVVARRPIPPEGRIDLPLRRIGGARGERTEIADRDDKDAARAITDYRTLDHAGQKLAWLELSPLTGRTHQLRVHCVAIGAPILGDVKYARPDQNNAFSATVAGLSSELHLHARALRLPHPAGGTLLVEADLPPHMIADVPHPGLSRAGGADQPSGASTRSRGGDGWRTLPRGVRIGLWSLAGVVGLIVVARRYSSRQLRS